MLDNSIGDDMWKGNRKVEEITNLEISVLHLHTRKCFEGDHSKFLCIVIGTDTNGQRYDRMFCGWYPMIDRNYDREKWGL